MDSSAVNVNVTVDDFDCILSYDRQSDWTTPDPSKSTFDATGSDWLRGTWHRTEVKNTAFHINFTGPAIYLYGHAGPEYGSYEIVLDGVSSTLSAYLANNASTPYILYSTNNLTYAPHTLTVRNLGAREGDSGAGVFLFDFLRTTVQMAPAGASITNTTIEEDNSALTYQGEWNNNKSPNFSGGGTAYTNADKSSVSLTFNGSAIYVLGDKKNDHGLYNVYLDGADPVTFSGISGCGGAFGMTCEQQQPSIKYFASNLGPEEHTIKIENLAGVNQSFFDLDSFVLTVPSTYAPRNLTASPEAGSNSSTPSSGNSDNTFNAASLKYAAASNVLLLAVGLLWTARRIIR